MVDRFAQFSLHIYSAKLLLSVDIPATELVLR